MAAAHRILPLALLILLALVRLREIDIQIINLRTFTSSHLHLLSFTTFVQLPPASAKPLHRHPNFHHSAQPTFTKGDDALHSRFVLKSREIDPFNTDLNSISKKLRLATVDFDPFEGEGDLHGKLKELMEKAGKSQ
jgi:hypothetical protein